jgi:hypothetical protein
LSGNAVSRYFGHTMKRLSLLFVLAGLAGCGTVTSPGDTRDTGVEPTPMIDGGVDPLPVPDPLPDGRVDPRPGTALAEGVDFVGGAGSSKSGPFSVHVTVGAGAIPVAAPAAP